MREQHHYLNTQQSDRVFGEVEVVKQQVGGDFLLIAIVRRRQKTELFLRAIGCAGAVHVRSHVWIQQQHFRQTHTDTHPATTTGTEVTLC